MAIYKETAIPAINEKHKEVVQSISFEGYEMDFGKAQIKVRSVGRKVDPESLEPILNSAGEKIYKIVGEVIETTLEQEVNVSIDGISTAEIFQWLSKWTDYKKGEEVSGLVVS